MEKLQLWDSQKELKRFKQIAADGEDFLALCGIRTPVRFVIDTQNTLAEAGQVRRPITQMFTQDQGDYIRVSMSALKEHLRRHIPKGEKLKPGAFEVILATLVGHELGHIIQRYRWKAQEKHGGGDIKEDTSDHFAGVFLAYLNSVGREVTTEDLYMAADFLGTLGRDEGRSGEGHNAGELRREALFQGWVEASRDLHAAVENARRMYIK